MRVCGGSNSGGVLDFSATCGLMMEGARLEAKICEGFCGGLRFYREVPSTAKSGRKLCPACVARMAKRMQVHPALAA